MPSSIAITQNHSLKQLNSFGIEAFARYFAIVQNTQDFQHLLSLPDLHNIPKFILGGGSNILLTKDFDGLVIKNDIKNIQILSEDDDHIWIEAGSGENWHEFVMYCIQHGYGGLENLSLIPGTVGAAPIQNIGAYGVELRDTLFELKALDLHTGMTKTFNNAECQFGYRDSIFKNSHRDKFAILSVTFKLDKKPTFHLNYGNIKETIEQMQLKEINLKTISDTVIQIRRSKLPDPKQVGNAGSFFKNPIVPTSQFLELQKRFPDAPHFPTENADNTKVPAGWLIEQCGWKGKRIGDIGVYEKQALIIVNFGAGTGAEIKQLSQDIQLSVQNAFGIHLMTEVNFI
jgi:UDP-N-acetylmuramate dehydrogenase